MMKNVNLQRSSTLESLKIPDRSSASQTRLALTQESVLNSEVWNNEFDYGVFEEDAMDRPTVPPIKEMDL